MDYMKKIFAVLCAALLLCCCTDDKAQKTAEGFLTSYLMMDYDNAVAYCDSNVTASLRLASDNWQALDTTLLKSIREAAGSTTFSITEVDTESQKDKAFVKYMLFPLGGEQGLEMKMTLEKRGGKWLVCGLE
jgi:hypothetical protein